MFTVEPLLGLRRLAGCQVAEVGTQRAVGDAEDLGCEGPERATHGKPVNDESCRDLPSAMGECDGHMTVGGPVAGSGQAASVPLQAKMSWCSLGQFGDCAVDRVCIARPEGLTDDRFEFVRAWLQAISYKEVGSMEPYSRLGRGALQCRCQSGVEVGGSVAVGG